jgi:hypothetical protein
MFELRGTCSALARRSTLSHRAHLPARRRPGERQGKIRAEFGSFYKPKTPQPGSRGFLEAFGVSPSSNLCDPARQCTGIHMAWAEFRMTLAASASGGLCERAPVEDLYHDLFNPTANALVWQRAHGHQLPPMAELARHAKTRQTTLTLVNSESSYKLH